MNKIVYRYIVGVSLIIIAASSATTTFIRLRHMARK